MLYKSHLSLFHTYTHTPCLTTFTVTPQYAKTKFTLVEQFLRGSCQKLRGLIKHMALCQQWGQNCLRTLVGLAAQQNQENIICNIMYHSVHGIHVVDGGCHHPSITIVLPLSAMDI